MRIGRGFELRVDKVCQEHEVMREDDVNETSVGFGCDSAGTLVGVYQLRIP